MKGMRRHCSGQVALLLILILTVVSAVVLSAVGGVITNLRVVDIDEESSQALRVAEAGIEEELKTLTGGGVQTLEGTTYTVSSQAEGINGFVTAEDIVPGEVVEVNIVDSTARPGEIEIYWGDANDQKELPVGAIEVIRYRKIDNGNYEAIHYAFDTDNARVAENGFSLSTRNAGTYQGFTFMGREVIGLTNRDYYVRVRVLYNQQRIAVKPSAGRTFGVNPYRRIVSEAETAQGVVRKVEAIRTESTLPLVFDAALYSGGELVK